MECGNALGGEIRGFRDDPSVMPHAVGSSFANRLLSDELMTEGTAGIHPTSASFDFLILLHAISVNHADGLFAFLRRHLAKLCDVLLG
jgi:hypothetical protein